ncbi:MAG TPA: hypothetical protein VFZ35_05865 [Sphingomicrobium sp.]
MSMLLRPHAFSGVGVTGSGVERASGVTMTGAGAVDATVAVARAGIVAAAAI